MIAIDTSALIAIFRLEPEADAFLKAIVAARTRYISAMSVLETSMVMIGRTPGTAAANAFAPLDDFILEAGIAVAPFDGPQAWLARDAFLRYGKGRHKAALNMGDCVSYALAMARGAPLLFKGEDFPYTDVRIAIPRTG